ncbi:lactonase family protein [Nocardioides rubriscoriae]|uniref:lactonase family protein n=1 Tax=Nocardioides rubriscoriae TaxID=642762 RepID=UPI0011DF806F|nr:beta-propeller fold lactonase family protein [Nocardioides rubriscoriae]
MQIHHRVGATASALALALTGLAGTTSAQATTTQSTTPSTTAASPVVGHTYVNDNNAGANAVAAFDRHADGSLTPIPGSPFATGGSGLGRGLGSQGAIQRSDDGRFLLAVNAGSDSISVLRLGADGVPTPVGTPVPSGGKKPVSIAVHDSLVYVANGGEGGENYTGFRLSGTGSLTAIPGSTFALPDGSHAGDVLFDPSGKRLIGTRDDTSQLDSFKVHGDGRIAPVQVGTPTAVAGPIGAQFSPTHADQLFVTLAHGGPGTGTVAAYDVSRNGTFDPIGPGLFPNGQTATCWVEITADGRYLFAVNTAALTISRYAVSDDGELDLLGNTPFNDGVGAVDARLSPDGRTLSVTGGRGRVVSVFAVEGGDLTELASSPTPLPAASAPTGIVVT